MNWMTTLGAVLVALAIVAVLVGSFGYTETKPLLRAGPIQIDTQEEHRLPVPVIAGAIVLIGGLGLILAGRRA